MGPVIMSKCVGSNGHSNFLAHQFLTRIHSYSDLAIAEKIVFFEWNVLVTKIKTLLNSHPITKDH